MSNGRRVLVVDDEVDFAGFVSEACRRVGCEVSTCHSSGAAKKTVQTFTPDVVVLDIVMPGEDGIEFLQWFGREGHKASMILVTGYNPKYAEMAGELSRVVGLEVSAVLTKPVRMKTLQETLQQFLPAAADS